MKYGFTFYHGHKDVFIETTAKYKTVGLAKKILHKLNIKETPYTINELMRLMQKAICEEKQLKDGRKYYDIYGENFGGHGSFVDDGFTIIIKL